ncbi:hypothetical protein HNY73_017168 [Argiope bruennichi]|uniref:Uncharacterized protein n=1 Tax=Argiope bruennichi TaxID=94029 RepID=A0A8T0EM14_ARGBR|nr:hypothetical protein HNY73_017168 [Argiope bruennichi]
MIIRRISCGRAIDSLSLQGKKEYVIDENGLIDERLFPISLDRKTSRIEPPDGLPLPSEESDVENRHGADDGSSPALDMKLLITCLTLTETEKLEPRAIPLWKRLLRPVQRL